MKENTYKILRIIFCCACVACAATAIFIFTYFGWWGMMCVLAALVFGVLMVVFKRLQEAEQNRNAPKAIRGDFITGPASPDDGQE